MSFSLEERRGRPKRMETGKLAGLLRNSSTSLPSAVWRPFTSAPLMASTAWPTEGGGEAQLLSGWPAPPPHHHAVHSCGEASAAVRQIRPLPRPLTVETLVWPTEGGISACQVGQAHPTHTLKAVAH